VKLQNDTPLRLDAWLWRVRFVKTRSQATVLCKGGKVRQGDIKLKAARLVFPGDEFEIRIRGRYLRVRVLALPAQRVSNKIVTQFFLDISPPHLTIHLSGMGDNISRSAYLKPAEPSIFSVARSEKFKMEDYQDYLDLLAQEWEE